MILDFILLFTGLTGFLLLYIILAHLSARMGEGMAIRKYYYLYYIAILVIMINIPVGWVVQYEQDKSFEDTLFSIFIIGNAIASAASFKYWWWLKDELLEKREGGL